MAASDSYELEFQNRYIAFIDVLGFSSLVESANKGDLSKLKSYFATVQETLNHFDEARRGLKKIAISDSIILATGDSQEDLKELLKATRLLQTLCAKRDIWLRGGISYGQVHIDDTKNIIVGQGFINAYLLEKAAVYPRIIIDPKILRHLFLDKRAFYAEFNGNTLDKYKNGSLIHEYISNGSQRFTTEDSHFLCYASKIVLQSLIQLHNNANNEVLKLEHIFKFIEVNLYSTQKHYSKYLWLKKYFQEVILEYYKMWDNGDIEGKKCLNDFYILFENL
jgi:hypothetical protein